MRTRLKGGSLSGTYLMENELGKFVRKEVSTIHNREYGFQRWYSQLKKLQRFGVLFPGLFPEVLRYGTENEIAYFDMPFIYAINAHEYLMKTTDFDKIRRFNMTLFYHLEDLHTTKIKTNDSSIKLYIAEEIDARLRDCYDNEKFTDFLKYNEIVFNGEKIVPFLNNRILYEKAFEKYYVRSTETFTHGNITLENLLYSENDNKFYFIDPYEETIVDSKLAEYSQILQSSNSKYEIYNSGVPIVEQNSVSMDIPTFVGLDYFNAIFTKQLFTMLRDEDMKSVKLFEISQFIRMLPFKKVVDEKMMIFFYTLASKLFHEFLLDEN